MNERRALITRTTNENSVRVSLGLDGQGKGACETRIPLLDHLLVLFARHGRFDLEVRCSGSLDVAAPRSLEEVGVCLGLALDEALGTDRELVRFAHSYCPMEETLARTVVDLSGQPSLLYRVPKGREHPGVLDPERVEDFWRELVAHARIHMHIEVFYGHEAHRLLESVFISAARALRQASRFELSSGSSPRARESSR